ncbi:hypothetical protein [Litchfieldia alkalitelluris]|uniref:hypothetical protein n=1 Tax=Litchfieldia alkalitelluris TaxID=304268 RepID=UPI0014729F06|nr:hypothetical protein [Litchfieldia alkalitelluris]
MKEVLDILTPTWLNIFFAFLAFAIPYTVAKIYHKLRVVGDPPWKKSEGDDS